MLTFVAFVFVPLLVQGMSRADAKNDPRNNGDLALWIDEKQVKMFSGMKLHIPSVVICHSIGLLQE